MLFSLPGCIRSHFKLRRNSSAIPKSPNSTLLVNSLSRFYRALLLAGNMLKCGSTNKIYTQAS